MSTGCTPVDDPRSSARTPFIRVSDGLCDRRPWFQCHSSCFYIVRNQSLLVHDVDLETSDTTSRASGTGCRLNLCHHAQRPVSPLSRLASDRGYHVTRCRQRELCAQLLRLSLEPTQTVSMHAVGYVYH